MHRLGKCDSEQARAEEAKAANGYSEETVRSEFFACHGTPPTVRQCWLPTAIGSSRLAATLERLRLMTQLYVGTPPMPKRFERIIRRFAMSCPSRRCLGPAVSNSAIRIGSKNETVG